MDRTDNINTITSTNGTNTPPGINSNLEELVGKMLRNNLGYHLYNDGFYKNLPCTNGQATDSSYLLMLMEEEDDDACRKIIAAITDEYGDVLSEGDKMDIRQFLRIYTHYRFEPNKGGEGGMMLLDDWQDETVVRPCDYCGKPIYDGEEYWEIEQLYSLHDECVKKMTTFDMVDFLDIDTSDIMDRFDFVSMVASH